MPQILAYLGNRNTKNDRYMAIVIRDSGMVKTYLAFTDNLGSILCVMDENGTKVFDASYDAWGRQTVTLNTIGLHRGYTGHEMLMEFDIINMNGRLYDPILGRFFSPDNYVQMPDNSQNFNRYSYCLNNPLKYTDPDGQWFGIDDLLIAAAGFLTGYLSNAVSTGNWGWSSVKSGLTSTVMPRVGFNTAGLATGSITKATWNQVGSICLNGFVNKAFPSLSIPINDHLSISLSPSFGFGENGLTAGMLSSFSYTDDHLNINISGGITNNYSGWNISGTYDQWGGGFGKTYYNAETVKGNVLGKQIVGTVTLLARGKVSFSLSNDMFGKKYNDRWRTSAAELSIGDFSIGTYVTTNDGKRESHGHHDSNTRDPIIGYNKHNMGAWNNRKVYCAPFWIGFKYGNQIHRFGYSAKIVQSLTQNVVHKYLVPTPYFIPGKEFYSGPFSYAGYNSPLSLW
ncbi:RHS repeat-associated core domain-containing protein [Segatella bryantii]|uniref:polymorphic toxin type 23 domain-containing protein n=1 Tax=Segatella bryantii TaxID=77095 RepID=UPI00089C874A|nr:polymorphic toxin type 23 domain-containing protein [Segatella bryantii]SEA66463.1 RHS repeat-associated core domain-containing protein [Segatella bryantii]